jgi:hypothetical protein
MKRLDSIRSGETKCCADEAGYLLAIAFKSKEVREAQKRYFSKRDNLIACKQLEAELDKLLNEEQGLL